MNAFCKLGEDVDALNSMSNDAITNTAEAQQSQGKDAGDLGMQRIQLCLAADQNCKNALEKCIKLGEVERRPPNRVNYEMIRRCEVFSL
jgi:hypothetical protein